MSTQTHSFHNTVNENGQTLIGFEEKAKSQDDDVMDLFNSKYDVQITPEMALNQLKFIDPIRYKNCPITSIRRAFSNLRDMGLIRKTETTIMGNYGRRVHCWKSVDQTNDKT